MKASGDLVIARDRVIGVAAGNDQAGMVEHTIDCCHPERVGANATPSRRIPTTIVPEQAASGSSHKSLKGILPVGSYQGTDFSRAVQGKNPWASAPATINKIMQTIKAVLCEIFDESAYDRFLLRARASRSRASYREFTRERDAAMVKKPRCC